MRDSFFPTTVDDDALEASNASSWVKLIDRVRADGFPVAPRRVLDVGCHRGGLLELVGARWGATHLYGIEPIVAVRMRAMLRLRALADVVEILDPEEWHRVPDLGIDLLLCYEVLHLLPDLDCFFSNVARVLAPTGCAYVVLGSHAENPTWSEWKPQLEAMGHPAFSHQPIDIMKTAGDHGLVPSVRPLLDPGWVIHDPRDPIFSFSSVSLMLDHHYRQKLVFRFSRQ